MRSPWHDAIREHARKAGVDLPPTTVDELALHLDDLYAAAIAEGASPAEARARASAALQESTLDVLRRYAARDARRLQTARANDDARALQGRSFLVLSSLRMALRLFRQHPSFRARHRSGARPRHRRRDHRLHRRRFGRVAAAAVRGPTGW